MNLRDQLKEVGFSESFTPRLTSGTFEAFTPEDGVGKGAYKYTEVETKKGISRTFVYIIWNRMASHEVLTEIPEGLTKKDVARLERDQQAQSYLFKTATEAIQARASFEAKAYLAKCVAPTIPPAYLRDRGLKILHGYVVDKENQEALVLPLYGPDHQLTAYVTIYPNGDKVIQEGGKKEGAYGVIEGQGQTMYICEGFSTAASIFEATGATCFFVDGCGNYLKAIPNILKYKSTEFKVLACDDDHHNTVNLGFTLGFAAARTFGLILKRPEFQKLDGKATTDFDDVRRLQGLPEVKRQLELTELEKEQASVAPTVKALGFKNGVYYLTSTQNQTIQGFQSLSKENLLKLMTIEYWEARYGRPGANGAIAVPWDRITSELMADCHKQGVYTGDNIRSLGVYLDQGRKVVHLGDRLLCEGKTIPVFALRSKYTYTYTQALDDIHPEPLTDAEAQEFAEKLKLSTIKTEAMRQYVLGFMVSSILGGALDWRPHIYLSGRRGSGKTQLTEVVNRILNLGFTSVYTHAVQSTAVGVAQQIASSCIPIFFDEVESDTARARVTDFVVMCRAASSASDAATYKGTADQNGTKMKLGFSAWMAGISFQLTQDSDKSRFAYVATEKSRNNTENWKELSVYWMNLGEEFAKRYVARIIKNAEVILANIEKAKRYVDTHLGNQRLSDQYGTLLAGALAFQHINPISEAELEVIRAQIEKGDEAIENSKESSNEMDLLNDILDTKIRLSSGDFTTPRRELYKEGLGEESKQALGEFGLIWLRDPSDKTEGILVKANSKEIRDSLRDTPAFAKNYTKMLERIEGSRKNLRARFQGNQHRGIFIPMNIIFSDGNEKEPEKPF